MDRFSAWPHRLAILLAIATFPLIWVGGLVTTYDAGMAVPDWPTTYGYNLLAYPWQTWLVGPWDLFIEHGHRLLGALVGMIAIALVLVVWRLEQRRWIFYLSLAALVLVIFQGVLGGMRVVFDDRTLAKLHGCVGPAFFALVVGIATCTSRRWRDRQPQVRHPGAGALHRCAMLTVILAYLQLVIGANLRHVAVDTSPMVFRVMVVFHLLLAAVLVAHAILILVQGWLFAAPNVVVRPAVVLAILIGLQVLLGGATWIVNYSWPALFAESSLASGFTIQSRGWMQSVIVTGHVAMGSLILATGVQLALRAFRFVRAPRPASQRSVAFQGAMA